MNQYIDFFISHKLDQKYKFQLLTCHHKNGHMSIVLKKVLVTPISDTVFQLLTTVLLCDTVFSLNGKYM